MRSQREYENFEDIYLRFDRYSKIKSLNIS